MARASLGTSLCGGDQEKKASWCVWPFPVRGRRWCQKKDSNSRILNTWNSRGGGAKSGLFLPLLYFGKITKSLPVTSHSRLHGRGCVTLWGNFPSTSARKFISLFRPLARVAKRGRRDHRQLTQSLSGTSGARNCPNNNASGDPDTCLDSPSFWTSSTPTVLLSTTLLSSRVLLTLASGRGLASWVARRSPLQLKVPQSSLWWKE